MMGLYKIILLIIFLLVCTPLCAAGKEDHRQVQVSGRESKNPLSQTYQGFVEEFKKAPTSQFAEQDLNRVLRDYSGLVMTGLDTTQLENEIEGRKTSYFALAKIQKEPFYQQTIAALIQSKNPCHRILAYITLASAGDSSQNAALLKATNNESSKDEKRWSGLALLYLRDSHTAALFDFLIANEDFEDAHMMPFYMALDKAALRQTAYEKITSKNPRAKILAVQSLSVTDLTPETERVVKEAVKTWDPKIRGYAIYTLKKLSVGNLKSILVPLLKDNEIRDISLAALANSPTLTDQQYLSSLIPAKGKIPKDVLNAYLNSTSSDSVRKWLTLVRDHQTESDYNFFVSDQPLLTSDPMLKLVKDTISKTHNSNIREELVRAMEGRQDADSINLQIQLLTDPDSSVRYWAASSLEGNTSAQLQKQLPLLIRNPKARTVALTNLIIQNKIDGLQDVYESLLYSDKNKSTDWYRSSLEYLSEFPRKKDQQLFQSILQSKKDAFIKRFAVTGLGNLRDQSSVDLIEAALRAEPPNDLNALSYLIAFGQIKGAKAKSIIESYKNSKNETIHDEVTRILKNW